MHSMFSAQLHLCPGQWVSILSNASASVFISRGHLMIVLTLQAEIW